MFPIDDRLFTTIVRERQEELRREAVDRRVVRQAHAAQADAPRRLEFGAGLPLRLSLASAWLARLWCARVAYAPCEPCAKGG